MTQDSMTSNPARTPAETVRETLTYLRESCQILLDHWDLPREGVGRIDRAMKAIDGVLPLLSRTPTGDPSGAEEIARDIVSQVAVDEYQGHRLRDLIAAAIRALAPSTSGGK